MSENNFSTVLEGSVHLDASLLVVERIVENMSVEAFIYLEEQGVTMEAFVEKLLSQADQILIGSTRSVKPPELYVQEFGERWNNYLMEEEYVYFLASAMRGLELNKNGPEIRLTYWNIELALLLPIHPVHSLNISRGQGKSWFLILYYLFLCFRYRKKKGSKFTKYSMAENLLIFAGDDLAKQHIKQIRSWVEGNYVIWKRLADGKAYEPSATLMRMANGSQIIAKSFMSAARGFRGTLLIDDYNLEEFNQNTMVQDKMFDRITKALFPIASNPFSQIVMAATPISPTDLIQRIWKDGGSKIMKWEYRAIDSDGAILDYNLQPLSRILERRETYSKRAFLQEIMLIADVEVDRIFTWDILKNTKDESYSFVDKFEDFVYAERTETNMLGCDYSFSTSDVSDYNAFAALAWTVNIFGSGLFRLFHLHHEQVMSIPQQVRKVMELYHKLNINVVYSESNGMQTAISNQLIEMGLNVQKMNTTTQFKLDAIKGIPILATLMELNYLKFPYMTEEDKKVTDMILQQFYSMTIIEARGKTTKFEAGAGGHDDIVLAVSQGILGSKITDTLKLLNGSEAEDWNAAIRREEEMQRLALGKPINDQEND